LELVWTGDFNDQEVKQACRQTVSDSMFPDAAEAFTEEVYQYLLR
jgi:hypothetical protein